MLNRYILALAWVFASWARPIVVMSIIPFGLIGTLWGHYLWGINLSMFSIIGLIGMTGIICLLYTSPSPRDPKTSRMPSSA